MIHKFNKKVSKSLIIDIFRLRGVLIFLLSYYKLRINYLTGTIKVVEGTPPLILTQRLQLLPNFSVDPHSIFLIKQCDMQAIEALL